MAKVSIIPWIVKKMKKCLGITEDTNTASRSISSGDYVIWKGDAYKASSSISEGDTLSSSNLTAVTDGVGNDLKQAVANNTQAIAKFEGGLALPNGDCNNAKETGRYKATATNTNTPAGTHWNIDVIKYNDNQVTQTAHRVFGSSQVWERAYLSGTWSDWQQLAAKSDLGGARMEYYTVSPNTSTTLNYSYVAFIVVGRNEKAFEGFVTYEGTVISFHTNESITVSAVGNSTVTIANGTNTALHGLMITKS